MAGAPVVAYARQLEELLFSGSSTFVVPRFQRSYAWGADEVEEFWLDLESTSNGRSEDIHFIGAMVFANSDDTSQYWILDGQQRLTTTMILLSAMKDVLEELAPGSREAEEQIDLLKMALYAQKSTRPLRLTLNSSDNEFFSRLVREKKTRPASYESHKAMAKTYNTFIEHVQDLLGSHPKGPVAAAKQLWTALAQHLWYIHISVSEVVNAQMVFESLNAKGIELTNADLIKNHLLMQIEEQYGRPAVVRAAEKWAAMVDKVGDKETPGYIRAYWLSSIGMVRADGLYRAVRDRLRGSSSPADYSQSFLSELVSEADVYAGLRSPSLQFWGSKQVYEAVSGLRKMNIRVVYPLLMALWQKTRTTPTVFAEVAQSILKLVIRHNIVLGKPSNTLEPLYSEWAVNLRTGDMTVEDVMERLKGESPSREEFLAAFRQLRVKHQPTARYLLSCLNTEMERSEGRPVEMVPDEKLTLEHIIPKTLTDEWRRVLEAHGAVHEDVLHRIGNLTLLASEHQPEASNKPFAEKRSEVYEKSKLAINQDLVSAGGAGPLSEFGPREIQERQERLAEIAERLWSLE
ncbi:MAG: DUF262 domain-containing protein [Coriobacteriia bacterium]